MDFLGDVWVYVAALLPTIGLVWLFYVVMRNMVQGDRKERAAIREWERARAERGEDAPGR